MHLPAKLRVVTLTLVAAASGMLAAGDAWADEACCFTNRRYTGICRVTPGPGQTCSSILGLLNNISATNLTVCGSTEIRLGWTQTRCSGPSTGGPTASPGTVQPAQPQLVQPASPMIIPSGMKMQVSLDQGVGDAAWGQPVTGRLASDLIVDDAVVAPAGSTVRGHLSQPDPAVAADASDHVLELETVSVDGRDHPLVAEGSSSTRVAVSLPASPAGGEVEFGPATPLLPADEAVELTADSLQEYRQAIVAANLQLSELESVHFWPLYREYRQAVEQVNARRFQLLETFAASYETLEGEKAMDLLEQSMAMDEDQLKLKQAWLPRFREILPDAKVVRYFQIENKLEAVVRTAVADVVPLVR